MEIDQRVFCSVALWIYHKPIQPSTLLDDLHPARFLKVSDLLDRWKVQQATVTISRLTHEETTPNLRDIDPATKQPASVIQPVLYFKTKAGIEFPRGYLLSVKVDIESLKAAHNATTAGELIGKRITLTVGEHKKKAVLRISPPKTPRPAIMSNRAFATRKLVHYFRLIAQAAAIHWNHDNDAEVEGIIDAIFDEIEERIQKRNRTRTSHK
jgi:hypothetical protein